MTETLTRTFTFDRIVSWFMTATAVGCVIWWIHLAAADPSSNTYRHGDVTIIVDYAPIMAKPWISITVMFCALLCHFRRLWLRRLTMVAAALIILQYALWWLATYRMVRATHANSYDKIAHTLFLFNATWWDIWILLIALLVIASRIVSSSYPANEREFRSYPIGINDALTGFKFADRTEYVRIS